MGLRQAEHHAGCNYQMSEPAYFKIECATCKGHIEFPKELHGQTIPCPHCGLTTVLRVAGYIESAPFPTQSHAPPPIQRAPQAPAKYGKIESKTERAGAGCLVQGLGLLLMVSGFFTLGIGFIIGLVLLVAGGRMALKTICSECGNPIANKSVKVCPACKTHFK